MQDLKPGDNRTAAMRVVGEVNRRFDTQVPLLDPIEDMKLSDSDYRKVRREGGHC